MSDIRLSICIPTFNFGSFIGETLASLADQMTSEVEVIIVDGASTDNTPDVVRRASSGLPRLRYHRRERNMGLDRDLAETVNLAQGEYCWLFSSDDIPQPGSIRRILKELESNCDVYISNRIECDRYLAPIRLQPWLTGQCQDHTFDCASRSQLIEYLQKSRSLGALFSYISSIVVSRRRWNEVGIDEAAVGTNYAHVVRLLSIVRDGGRIRYVRDPLVKCRGGNDSFATEGIVSRLLLDFRGYEHVMQQVFPNDMEIQGLIKTVFRREHPRLMLARIRAKIRAWGAEVAQWRELREYLLRYGYGTTCVWAIDTCRPFVKTLRQVKHAAIGLMRAVMKKTRFG